MKLVRRFLIPLLFLALAGGAFWHLALCRRLAAEQARSAALAAELTAVRGRLASQPGSITAAAPGSGGHADETAPRSMELDPAFLENPVVLNLLTAATRDSVESRYGLFFQQLELPPRQREHLKNLLVERQMRALDVVRAAQAGGLSAAEAEPVLAESAEVMESNVRLVLGQPGFESFQAYEHDIAAHGLLDQLETRIGFGGPPLSPEQSAAVLRLLADTTEPNPASATDRAHPLARALQSLGLDSPLVAPRERRITDRTLEAARSVLNEAQLEALVQLGVAQATPASNK